MKRQAVLIPADRAARNKFAGLLRHYAAGLISNDALEEGMTASDDPALHEIFANGVWFLYDDLREYKRVGRDRLEANQRAFVARTLLFLKTNQPYRWPPTTGLRFLPHRIMAVATFGWLGRVWLRRHWRAGEASVWPFFGAEEFAAAKQSPVYLSGS